jgi:RNA polymerase sigma-70 factor (ECF subfamily)
MDDPVERALIARCRSGDEAAVRELVDRFRDLVFALIARQIRDRSRAEDLAQEVFLRVYRALPYFRGEARLATWLYRITYNVCQQDRQRQAGPVVAAAGAGTVPEPAARDTAFDDFVLRDRMDKAIEALPAQDRFLIAAHYLQGMKYEDLAAALDLPLGTIKVRLYRARQRLREVLEAFDAL